MPLCYNSPTVKPEFTHLHVHSDYSFLDGACKIGDLVAKVKALGMRSCALTDHGHLLGAIEFYDAAIKAGVKPILGIEAYVAPRSRHDKKEVKGMKEPAHHLTLLVRNEKGYRNLLKLSSLSYQEGFYYKPRMDKEILQQHHEGLIALSGCPNSEFGQACRTDQTEKALKAADDFRQIFGPENFYLEIQSHGFDDERKIHAGARQAAKDMGLKVVATNDCHYMAREDARAHDALLAISTGRQISDPDRLRYPSPEFYIKSPEEMAQAFPHDPDALLNSLEIAEKCHLEMQFNQIHLPRFELPQGFEKPGDYLRVICEKGARERYGDPLPDRVRERMDYELSVMEKMGFASYFLIVWDLRRFARENGVRVGPGRGSAAGSLVGYCLGITSIDPLRYDLIFERFLNPSRKEMPDIDLDFSNEDRGRVIDYIFQRYGADHVAQIITTGTMKSRLVLRDVGRALGIDLKKVDQLAKKIPKVLDITLQDSMRMEPEIAKEVESDPQVKELWEIALRLEGNARHAGKHASGVVISDRPLTELVPLYAQDGAVMTQYDMNALSKLGILKIDILGLETLTVLDRAVKLVEQTRGVNVDLVKLPLDDRETYEMLGRGTVKGVFQLETSRGMRELVQKMKPDRIDDLIATIALFRPGPLQSGMVEQYIRCKHGLEAIKPIHPDIDPILKETNGVILYQEQVMRIANVMAGFSMADADGLRKAMGKKIPEIMAKYKEQFIQGAKKKGVKEDLATQVFDLMAFFAGYGFNKCVVGSTLLTDARTGERTTVEDLFRNGRPLVLHALGEDGRLRPRRVTNVVRNGRKTVFELRTAQGRRITATGNHPFRTLAGWTNLEDLEPGDRVAAPRRLEIPRGGSWPKHEIIALGGLLSEGNACHPTRLYYFGKESEPVRDFAAAAECFPETTARVSARRGLMEVCLSTGRDARFQKGMRSWNAAHGVGATLALPAAPARSGAFRWADSPGILGLRATEKKMPADAFELCDADLEVLLGRLWAGDGFISNSRLHVPFYATSSRPLARDVQDLLLRLGIVSGVHDKRFGYRGGWKAGFTVRVVGTESVETFLRRVAPHCVGRDKAVAELARHLRSTRRDQTSQDTVPPGIRTLVDQARRAAGLTWKELERKSGVSTKEFVGRGSAGKRGFRRSTIGRLAAFFRSVPLEEAATSDVFWDRVVSIEPKGIQETYDLAVDRDHNFVADGLIVHNSHSAAYGIVSYQTAYLKTKWPVEYMAALLSCAMGNTDKLAEYIEECRQLGIEVLPPDVNESELDFKVLGKQIRFGLGAVKGAGEKAILHILEARRSLGGRIATIYDFCETIDSRHVDRKVAEQLVKCGAFDSTGAKRAALMECLEQAVHLGSVKQAERKSGQLSIFDAMGPAERPPLPDIPEWPQETLLAYEKEVLGCYVTANPLLRHEELIRTLSSATVDRMPDLQDGQEVTIGGIISGVKALITKTGKNAGQKYAMFKFGDLTGSTEAVCFSSDYERCRDLLANDAIVFASGRVGFRNDQPSLRVSSILPVEKARELLTGSVRLRVTSAGLEEDLLMEIKDVLRAHPGSCPVFFEVETPEGHKVLVKTPNEHFVSPSEAFLADIEEVLGSGHVGLERKPTK